MNTQDNDRQIAQTLIVTILIVAIIVGAVYLFFRKTAPVPAPAPKVDKTQTVPVYPCTDGKCA